MKAVNKVSDNKKEADKQYNKIRAAFLREHPFCGAKIEGHCKVVATQIHHKKGKATEEDYLNPKYFLACCFECHSIIEKNPNWSKKNGLSISRLAKTK
jgi:hypothetical protein